MQKGSGFPYHTIENSLTYSLTRSVSSTFAKISDCLRQLLLYHEPGLSWILTKQIFSAQKLFCYRSDYAIAISNSNFIILISQDFSTSIVYNIPSLLTPIFYRYDSLIDCFSKWNIILFHRSIIQRICFKSFDIYLITIKFANIFLWLILVKW